MFKGLSGSYGKATQAKLLTKITQKKNMNGNTRIVWKSLVIENGSEFFVDKCINHYHIFLIATIFLYL